MAVDASMRELQVPPRYMPYLEKHRIYELFYDLGNQLAMAQPQDTLVFIKRCLERLERGRDRRLILFMPPPYLDRTTLAHQISVKTGCEILSRYLVCLKPGDFFDPVALAINTARIINTSEKEGWILSDYPDTVEEAKLLIENGVLPTHSYLLLPDENDNAKVDNEKVRALDTTPSILYEFDKSIYRLRELFKSSLKIVKIKNRTLEEIADLCAKLTLKMPPRHAPKLFRVALIGPRGSRRRTLAKLLKKKFNLVHVDIDQLVNSAKQMENDLGDEIRYLDKNQFSYPLKIVFDMLKARLNRKDCLDRGYVLTNFPCSVEEFVMLDSMETPPNKVIFLDIDGRECQARLEDRVINTFTGKLYSKQGIEGSLLKSQTLTHPDDETCKVTEEIKFYNQRAQGMLDYCGKTCSVVDARGCITALLEKVEAVLMASSPVAKPRSGKFPPWSPKSEYWSSVCNMGPRMSYPLSQTEVVPLIESTAILRRFEELKKVPHIHATSLPQNSIEILYIKEDKESSGKRIIGKEERGRREELLGVEANQNYSKLNVFQTTSEEGVQPVFSQSDTIFDKSVHNILVLDA